MKKILFAVLALVLLALPVGATHFRTRVVVGVHHVAVGAVSGYGYQAASVGCAAAAPTCGGVRVGAAYGAACGVAPVPVVGVAAPYPALAAAATACSAPTVGVGYGATFAAPAYGAGYSHSRAFVGAGVYRSRVAVVGDAYTPVVVGARFAPRVVVGARPAVIVGGGRQRVIIRQGVRRGAVRVRIRGRR